MFLASLPLGFAAILLAAVSGGIFGLQYRVMKKYTVENSSRQLDVQCARVSGADPMSPQSGVLQ